MIAFGVFFFNRIRISLGGRTFSLNRTPIFRRRVKHKPCSARDPSIPRKLGQVSFDQMVDFTAEVDIILILQKIRNSHLSAHPLGRTSHIPKGAPHVPLFIGAMRVTISHMLEMATHIPAQNPSPSSGVPREAARRSRRGRPGTCEILYATLASRTSSGPG